MLNSSHKPQNSFAIFDFYSAKLLKIREKLLSLPFEMTSKGVFFGQNRRF